MRLEQIRDKAYRDARRKVPNPIFGANMQEHGETEEEVIRSIEDWFRDEMFVRSMQVLHQKRPKYRLQSLESYFCELTEAMKLAGATVFRVCDDDSIVLVKFDKTVYRLRLSGVVKLEIPLIENVTMNAAPNEVARLLAMIHEIEIPSKAILKESLKQYKWHKIMEVSAFRLIEDVLKEHRCGCYIHICGKDRLKLLIYGKEASNMNDIFMIYTDLNNIRNDLIDSLGNRRM